MFRAEGVFSFHFPFMTMLNRRNALKALTLGAVGASAGTWLTAQETPRRAGGLLRRSAAQQAGGSSTRPLRLGAAQLHISDADPEAWAQRAVDRKFRAVNAPGNLNVNDTDRIKAFTQAVEKRNLIFAEVGRWVNLMDADPQKREANLKLVTEGLALAEELGACCCVDIAGSFSTEHWAGPHPQNVSREFFDLAVENARKIIDAVKPKRTKFAYEMMGWAFPDTADSYLRLVRGINRSGFGVHIDVVNMVNSPDKFWNATRLINEAFDKLGPMIVSAHFKDLRWIVPDSSVHFEECVIGEGSIDFATYLTRMAALSGDVPLIIEHMRNAEEYDRCRDYLFEVGESKGIAFA